ncbi:O-antigen ligase [Micromonospora sp. WP24]|uniref:O-antigen ligase family protein n=1 Tax=Micromonospora sp. WP24 TaxID=2604469 RepID=UPI0011DCFC33|nr:O-antigen ligase family protein [Micromonospora sp. WP24]
MCVIAALVPVNPQWAYQYGLWLAVLALAVSGQRPRLGAVDCVALLLCSWVTVTSTWTRDATGTDIAVRAWWTVVLLLLAARHVMTTRRRLLLVAGTLFAGTMWAAVKMISVGDAPDQSVLRQGVPGVGINYTAYSLATGALVGLMLLVLRAGGRTTRFAALLAGPVLVYATVLTGTRAGLIALVLAALYVLFEKALKQAWIAVGIASTFLLVTVPFGRLSQYQPEWLNSVFDRPLDDLSGRLLVWPIAEASFWESPWVGIGAGAFPSTNPYFGIGAHSLVLSLGNDVGVIGIAMFAALIGLVLRDAAPAAGRPNRLLAGTLIVVWTPIWLSGHWEISPVAWLVLALWSRLPVALAERQRPGRHRRLDLIAPHVLHVGTAASPLTRNRSRALVG